MHLIVCFLQLSFICLDRLFYAIAIYLFGLFFCFFAITNYLFGSFVSGLSSDSSDPSPRRTNSTSSSSTTSSSNNRDDFVRTETHFRTYRSDDQSDKSDKSSYSEKHDKEASKETPTHSDLYDFDENDATYAERNVLQEEATTVQTETISVEKLRQRFDAERKEEEKAKKKMSNPRPQSRQKSAQRTEVGPFYILNLIIVFPLNNTCFFKFRNN